MTWNPKALSGWLVTRGPLLVTSRLSSLAATIFGAFGEGTLFGVLVVKFNVSVYQVGFGGLFGV